MVAFAKALSGRPEGWVMKRHLGSMIRDMRERRGMTQQELSQAVGHTYYTSISAIETGRNVPAPELYLRYCKTLGIKPKDFGKIVLEHTNPWLYALLFSDDVDADFERLGNDIESRQGHNPSTVRKRGRPNAVKKIGLQKPTHDDDGLK